MTDMEGDAMSHNQPNTTHSERLATPVNAHGDGIDTTPERVDETQDREHVDRAAKVIAEDAWQRSQQWEISPGKRSDAVGAWAECAARALADAGLLSPTPVVDVERHSVNEENP